MASFVPATDRVISVFSNSSADGLIMNFPSTLPTTTPATGPSNGISLTINDKLEASKAVISTVESWSTESGIATTCTSFLNPSANNGLIGLSINLDANVACSVGRPSLLINPPGILPTEYNFSR